MCGAIGQLLHKHSELAIGLLQSFNCAWSDLSPQNRVSEEVSSSLPLLHDLVISNISGTTRGQMCQCKVTSQELRQYTAAVLFNTVSPSLVDLQANNQPTMNKTMTMGMNSERAR